jgi:hypothetical protein
LNRRSPARLVHSTLPFMMVAGRDLSSDAANTKKRNTEE